MNTPSIQEVIDTVSTVGKVASVSPDTALASASNEAAVPKRKSIVLCVPGRTFSRRFLLCWTRLIAELIRQGYDFIISQDYSSVVHFARAKCLWANVLDGEDQKPFHGKFEYDAMVWIDSDIVFTPEDIFKLLESPHDFTSGLYMMENGTEFPVVETWDDDLFLANGSYKFMDVQRYKELKEAGQQYIKCAYTGLGMTVIKRGVLEKIKYPWFYRPKYEIITTDKETGKEKVVTDMMSEDVALCRNLVDVGVDLYCDVTIRVGHEKNLVL
jgi:hypothetical protein